MIDDFGEALQKLVSDLGRPLRQCEEITVTPSLTARRTYRLTFEDGSVLKGRYFISAPMAALTERIIQTCPASWWPRLLARHENATLEEWIFGEVLVRGSVDHSLIYKVGRTLGWLHKLTPPSLEGIDYLPIDRACWVKKLRHNLFTLTEAGLLSSYRSNQLEDLALSDFEERFDRGVVHRDLCPENLVLDSDGRLYSVDNGTLSIGTIAEDLCRLWYRWPMEPGEQRALADGYGIYGDPGCFLRPADFWAIVVVTDSARVQFSHSRETARSALERLGRFLGPTGSRAKG